LGAAFLALVTAAGLAGCDKKEDASRKGDSPQGGFPPPQGGQGGVIRVRNIQQVNNDMKQLGLAYHNFQGTYNRGPATVEELSPFFDNNAQIKEALQKGEYVFHWKLNLGAMTQGSSNTILAYEKDADAKGNRVVAMGDATVKTMNTADFQATLKAQGN
jgi:hypothetical protein